MKVRLLLLLCLPLLLILPAQAEEIKVKYKADKVEALGQQNVFRLIGNVELEVRNFTIRSQQLDYDTRNKILRSDVIFEMEQKLKDGKTRRVKGTSFRYDVNLRRVEAENVYLVIPAQAEDQEVYVQGELMTAYNDGERVIFRNGFYTTCSHFESPEHEHNDEDPYSREAVRKRATHYAIDAEILDFVQDKRVLAWNASVLTFENQAFWFPFWYIPLEGPGEIKRPDVDTGQNPVEGIFTRFKGYYKWNEYHDGQWYLTVMEKTGVGLGFQHDWVAYPNSITRLYFYGLPVTTDLLNIPQALFVPPDPLASAADGLVTQQTGGNSWQSSVLNWLDNKFVDREFEIRHKQRLLPHMEAEVVYSDKDLYNVSLFQAQRNPQRNFQFSLKDSEIFNLDPYTDLNLDTDLQLRQGVNSPQTTRFDAQDRSLLTQETRLSQTQNRTASFTTRLGQANLNLRSNWSNNFNQVQTQQIQQGLPLGPPDNQAPSGNENWNSTLDFRTPIDDNTNISANLVYNSNINGISATSSGTLNQTLQPRISLDQRQSWGQVQLAYEDFFDLSPPNPNAVGANGQIKKLPELGLRFEPFFKETFPITVESRIGRYFDPASVLEGSSLNEIGRTQLKLSMPAKEFDLGLGMKVNYSGSSFEQRFYQTLDAEYILTGRVNLKNDLTPYFIPNLSYERTIQDLENNNSPFLNFEPLGLRRTNSLTADLRFVNLPEFTMNITGGYDYLNRLYQPIRANISSEIGGQFVLRANSSYTPVNVTDEQVGQPLQDVDRNDYIHPGTDQTIPVTQDMVGSFVPFGGRWGNTTLGMRWRNTPEELYIGNLKTFGLEEGIPNGFEIGGDIAYDFHQGRINSLNGMLRFKLGESWQWHTEIDLIASVQPTLLPQNSEEWLGLEIPFRIVLRKDLHDFILTASWDSFYQQFNLSLSLLAFPFSTDDIMGNMGSLGNQLGQMNNMGGQIGGF